MKNIVSFAIAVNALLAHKMRTFLASLGILIGIASVIIMVAIGKGSQQEVMDVIAGMGENMVTINAGEMIMRGGKLRLSGKVTTLTIRDAKLIEDEIEEVELVAPFEEKRMNVKYDNNATETNISGSTLDFPLIRGYRIEKGEMFTERELKTASRVALI